MTNIEHGIPRHVARDQEEVDHEVDSGPHSGICTCGALIGWSPSRDAWVHTEAPPKGTSDDHVAEPRPPVNEVAAGGAREERPLIEEQVDALKHLVAALDLEHAEPVHLRDLTAIGFGMATAAYQASVIQAAEGIGAWLLESAEAARRERS